MKKLSWTGPKEVLQAGETYLSELTDAGAVGLQKPDADDGTWRLDAYYETPPDRADLDRAITEFAPGWRSAAALPDEELPEIDWVAHALEGLGIVRAGRFLLYGIHDSDKLPDDPNLVPIRIDANQAFGTGHHPTTAGCLELLSRFAGAPAEKILDLGCGSGVLAIAASKLWDRNVIGVDIDATSVDIARENADLNGVAERVQLFAEDGVRNQSVDDAAPFDFVFANILAGPLIELAPDIAARLVSAGRVMLAGLMAEQEDKVRAAYEKAGMKLINKLEHDTWPVLLFVKT